MKRGKFITFEGIDGAGKSTHLAWAADLLRGRGVSVVVTREPGGTILGEKLRHILLTGDQRIHPETETLMMFAARRQHLEEVIRPALQRGDWVLCDRFTDATYAYQSGGSGVPWAKVSALERWVHPGFQPDLTILFDIRPAIGRKRAGRKRNPDRFEREREAYYRRVRDGYRRRAARDARRFRLLDAEGTRSEVRKRLAIVLSGSC